MKLRVQILLLIVLFPFIAKSQGIVISELYPGGAGGSSTYKYDYIELYNPGNSAVVMNNWSIHYASCSGNFGSTNYAVFSGTIQPKSFFLLRTSSVITGGNELPITPDFTTTSLNMSGSCGKIILSSSNGTFSGSDPVSTDIVDKIAYGSANGGYETTPASSPSVTTALQRKAFSSSTDASMSSGGIDYLLGNGYDSNNNSTDFVITTPEPQNTASDPEPIGGGTDPALSVSPGSLSFGTVFLGNNAVKYYLLTGENLEEDIMVNVSGDTDFQISSHASGTFGASLIFPLADWTGMDTVFVQFTPASSGPKTASIQHTSLNVANAAIANLEGNGATPGDLTFDFNACTSSISDFTAYSVIGSQVWGCTTFGRDASDPSKDSPYGVQINGFSGGNNNVNEDWLISPQLPVNSTQGAYTFLSFWSRTRFAGAPLSIKASLDYPGSGNPNNYTWIDLQANLPAENSDIWTQTNYVDLSSFAGQQIYFAFVYYSSSTDGARWTIDDVSITSSNTPPPPSLTANPGSLNFGFKSPGSNSVLSTQLNGQFLTNDLDLLVSGAYQISLDGINFSNSLSIPKENLSPAIIYVQFSPLFANQSYAGSITATTTGLDPQLITLNGHTFDPASTLDVVGWNIEWFSGPNGPSDDLLQEMNALTVMGNIDADLWACLEIVDTSAFKLLSEELGEPGEFGYYICKYGSGVANENSSEYANAQKLGFIYRKSMIQPLQIGPLFYTTNSSDTAYNYWASGRFPLLMETLTTINGHTYPVSYILIHAKAQNSNDAYLRRKKASLMLKHYLDSLKSSERVVILGDYNDDLDETIATSSDAGSFYPASSYSDFVNDQAEYKAVTLSLSLSNQKSTVGYNDVIDHAIVSNEMAADYVNNSAQIITEVESWISNYGSTTSDHYPVKSSYVFSNSPLPITFIDASGRVLGSDVLLSWKANTSSYCIKFVIEKSLDGLSWSHIGEMDCTHSSGRNGRYEYSDDKFNSRNSYYRIKAVDTDGKTNLSRLIYLTGEEKSFIPVASPNPVGDFCTISGMPPVFEYTISGMKGEMLKTLSQSQGTIDLSGFPSGTYLITTFTGPQIQTIKLIKK